jgi:hypothetical protein
MMKRTLFLLAALLLISCSTSIQYGPWKDSDSDPAPVKANALRFQLSDSSITVAEIATPASDANASTKSVCPAGLNKPDSDWSKCLTGVNTHAAMAPAASGAASYIATPHDAKYLYLTSTTLSGATVSGQSLLYSQVTVTYKNNAPAIIAGVGTGAVSGFGVAGPAGAILGGVVGGLIAAPVNGPPNGENQQPFTIANYICVDPDSKNAEINASKFGTANLPLELYLPVTIAAAQGRPYANQADLSKTDTTIGASTCWHAFPNNHELNQAVLRKAQNTPQAPTGPRAPEPGDGWLFRLVSTTDPNNPPPGAELMSYYLSHSSGNDFPYSSCRHAKLQITYWTELAKAVQEVNAHTKASVDVVEFDTIVADPEYVYYADVSKGGIINFKADCGANVSMAADTSVMAAINATVTTTQSIYKAEQTWEAGKKTAK